MKILHMIAFLLVIVGALNWGIIGIGGFANFDGNVVKMLLGSFPMIERLVYVLVGLSALVLLATHKKDCRLCASGGTM